MKTRGPKAPAHWQATRLATLVQLLLLSHVVAQRSYLLDPLPKVVEPLETEMAHLRPVAALPPSFDWRNSSGVSHVTAITNQFLPAWCGRCVHPPSLKKSPRRSIAI